MAFASLDLIPFVPLLVLASAALLPAALRLRRAGSAFYVYAAVFLLSACRFMLAAGAVSDADIGRLKPELPLPEVQIEGRVAAPPVFYAGRRSTLVVPLRCEGLCVSNVWSRLRGTVDVRILDADSAAAFRVGERCRFRGELRPRTFPGGAPYELLVTTRPEIRLMPDGPRFPLRDFGERMRALASRRLADGMETHPDQLAVYHALLLGYRKAIPSRINLQFSRTGTLHIFAISGLHVGIVGVLIALLLKAVGVPLDKWGLALIPLLFFYVVATGMKSSAMRAFTMTSVYFVAPLFRRKPDVPTAIALSALLLLFWQPLQIVQIGFIYSFTVVSFIVLVFSVIPEERLQSVSGRWRGPIRYVASLLITSVAAFMASAPLSALCFGLFTPVSLLANLIVVPLTFCVVLCGWLSLLLPFASGIFNHAALFFINGLLGSTAFCAELPGAYFRVPSPPVVALVLWYLGWFALFTHGRRNRKHSAALILTALLLAAIPFLVR